MDLKSDFFSSSSFQAFEALSPTIVADYILKDTHAHVLVREDNAQRISFCVGFSNFEDFLLNFFLFVSVCFLSVSFLRCFSGFCHDVILICGFLCNVCFFLHSFCL